MSTPLASDWWQSRPELLEGRVLVPRSEQGGRPRPELVEGLTHPDGLEAPQPGSGDGCYPAGSHPLADCGERRQGLRPDQEWTVRRAPTRVQISSTMTAPMTEPMMPAGWRKPLPESLPNSR